jgi:geranylgeranylglycerol-phosphate geranylgeranyltransferase
MKLKSYREIIRPGTSIIAGLGAVIGAIISGAPPSASFLYMFLAVFFITGAGMVINDYYDIEIDKINAPHRPLPSGQISPRDALSYSSWLFIVGIFFSALINNYCLVLALINSVLEYLYSKYFKRTFLLGNIIVSWFTASTFLFGAFLTFNFKIVGIVSLLAFLANMGREIFKAIEDVRGDKKMSLDTLPIVAGIDSAKEIAQGFIASAVLLSPLPYLSGLLGSIYLRVVSIGNVLFLYSLSQAPTKIKDLTKIAMYIVLLAFLLGT